MSLDQQWQAVHMIVPTLYPHDGIGGHVLRTAEAQRKLGRRCEIFVEVPHPATAATCHRIEELDGFVDDAARTALVFQSGSGSSLPRHVIGRPESLIVHHHGITPMELLSAWSTESIGALTLGRRQLEELAAAATLGIGTSAHTADELRRAGFDNPKVSPPLLPPARAGRPAARVASKSPVVLFVGRITPSKAQHDLVEALAVLRLAIPAATLSLVGADAVPSYRTALNRLIASLGLEEAVTITGEVSDSDLDGHYRDADVLCCLSDHEGFGMPLIEAMNRGLPVVAHAVAAVSETVGAGAMLLETKEPDVVATALERCLTDQPLREAMVKAGHRRSEALSPRTVAAHFESLLGDLAETQGR